MSKTITIPTTLEAAVERCKEIDRLLAMPLTSSERNSLNWEMAAIIAAWVER